MHSTDPTFLGKVTAVSGSSITVQVAASLASGMAIIHGNTYRVAQVGSFIRIPQGYQDLYGIVAEVGATDSTPIERNDSGKWMRVELAGESIGARFERGLSQHPNINDSVHIVTERDLQRIYGYGGDDQVQIGTLSNSENIAVRLSLDALVTRHSAILGSTGAGKSTTVASLLRSIVRPGQENGSPAARILLLDIHGEYKAAFGDIAKVFSATPQPGEDPLHVPFWALEAGELLEFLLGPLSENNEIAFTDKVQELKAASLDATPRPGLDPLSLTVDSPVPFSVKKMWYELIDFETTTYRGVQRNESCLEEAGDADTLTPPVYTPHAMGSAGPFLNPAAKGIRRPLNLLRSRLLDRRYDFILKPGDWEPRLDGNVNLDLDTLLERWIGHERQITILDLSGVPSTVLVQLIGAILRIVYEALFWSRDKTEGGVLRPLLVVMEEAHRYLNTDNEGLASEVVKRIAKEGRKYGIGAMVVSQRPAEVDETVLSQCGTIVALRLSNPADRTRVKGTLPDNLSGLMDLLPVLRTGEAIIAGEAAKLPVRCRITLPAREHQPRSSDPEVTKAWATRRLQEDYGRVAASWRAQRTTAITLETTIIRDDVNEQPFVAQGEGTMDRMAVMSSNIRSVGYDANQQILEVEFLNGSVYQYFNVGQDLYNQFVQASSLGQFLHQYIKNAYAYSRVG